MAASTVPLTPAPSAVAARPLLNVFLVVDCSGSMVGERIASLNHAVRSAIPAMRAAATERTDTDVGVRVLRFSDRAEWQTPAPVPVDAFHWSDLTAGGETSLGAALSLLATAMSDAPLVPPTPPLIVLFSDGLPTDDAEAGLDALFASAWGALAHRLAVAVGPDADMSLLQEFIGRPGLRPLSASTPESLVRRIRWCLSAPVREVNPGDLAQQEASRGEEEAGGMIW